MKIENQVCTLEQAKRLKHWGIYFNCIFYWMTHEKLEPQIRNSADYRTARIDEENWYAAFTVAELGVMLPDYYMYLNAKICRVEDARYNNGKHISYYQTHKGDDIHLVCFKNSIYEAQARAAMLIFLIENNIITAEEVNQKLLTA